MSIRARLLFIALMATLVAAFFVATQFVSDRERDIAAATQRVSEHAAGIGNLLIDRIRGTEQLHFGLARARDLDGGDRAACSAFLSRVRDKYPQYTGILTINPDGQLFCDSLNTGRMLDLSDRSYFRQATAIKDAITLQPAFGRLTGTAVLQVAYPARDESGVLKFVLLASLNLEQLVQSRMKDNLSPGSHVMLADRDGLVLASSGGAPGLVRAGGSIAGTELFRFASAPEPGVRDIAGPGGEVHTWAATDKALLRESGILVLVGDSKEQMLVAVNRRYARNMAVLAGAAALLLLALWAFSELAIRRHIVTIASMVERSGRNEAGVRILEPHPRGELGALMGVLNRSAALQEHQRAAIEVLNTKLHDSQRLEAIGQLTGGVAHDFNNLLTVILGNAEVLQERLANDRELAPAASMVVEAAERGAELTHRLLAFARRQALAPRTVDVNLQVSALHGMLRRTLGEEITIEVASGDGLWQALVDPGQLDNALLNLCLNARDAMPQGGTLTIETANIVLSDEYANQHAEVVPGEYVMLAVSDTGHGIAAGDIAHVFEPFFTTKEPGKGTGLGLSMTYGFVKQSGGHVSISSAPDQGTTVKLYLPRTTSEVVAVEAVSSDRAVGGSETILLVEDNAMVRRFAHDQLVALGYRVVEASNGAQALETLREGRKVDLLFTDVVMPEMSGTELAARACELNPLLKVLYTSGYTDGAIDREGRLATGAQLLGKPYHRAELARMVRAALG